MREDVAPLRERLEALEHRLAQPEAQLEFLEGEDLAGLEDRLGDRLERITERLEHQLGALERRVDNHEGDHWRERR